MTTRSRRPAASSRRTLPRPALPAPPAADVERHGEPAAGPAQRSVGSPLPAARPADILALQRAAGNRQVQRALAARRLLSPAAPRGSASVIQRLRIVEDKKTGKLREAKADEEDALDVAKMTPGQRAIYRERIRTEKSVKLGEQFDLALKKSTPALDNIEDIYTINDELEALELSQKSKQPLDASLVKSIAAKLQDAQILLQTLQRGEDIVLYRGVVAEYTIRLSALDPKQKIGAVVEGQRAQIAITPADRQAYRDDVVNSVAWGGLAEANRVAEHLNLRVSIFRINSKGRYQRVITIGPPGGQNHGIDLLHLGDHYVAVRGALAGQPEGGERDEQLKTKPDGNCLYEALYIAAHQAKPTDIQRQAFIANIRQWLSQALSDAEIDASIVAIVSQGDVAGLGPKTKTVLAAKSRAEKVRQYDEKTLAQLTKPLTQLDQADQFGYQEKAATYLAERKKKPDSDETAAAFDALERALSSARHVLDMRRWATKTGDIVLPMGWWEPVRAGMPKRATANAKLLLESLTGARDAVVKYNLGAGAPKLDIRGLLEMLDAIEDKMKRMAAPGAEPDALQEDAREAAKIAIYRFVTEDVRLARARLVHLFQLAEGSTFRTGGPGLRPDLHYDFYPETEKAEGQGARATYAPKGFGKAESQLVTSMIDPKGSQPKGMQEGLSAVALKQAYPARFSNIVRSEDPHVEYFDNDGMPWDQKAPVSHGRVTTEEIMTGISGKLHEFIRIPAGSKGRRVHPRPQRADRHRPRLHLHEPQRLRAAVGRADQAMPRRRAEDAPGRDQRPLRGGGQDRPRAAVEGQDQHLDPRRLPGGIGRAVQSCGQRLERHDLRCQPSEADRARARAGRRAGNDQRQQGRYDR